MLLEMTVHLTRRRNHFPLSNPIPGIERVEKLNILDITVSHTLTFHRHVAAPVNKCSRSSYALKTICAHGVYGSALRDITRATLVGVKPG